MLVGVHLLALSTAGFYLVWCREGRVAVCLGAVCLVAAILYKPPGIASGAATAHQPVVFFNPFGLKPGARNLKHRAAHVNQAYPNSRDTSPLLAHGHLNFLPLVALPIAAMIHEKKNPHGLLFAEP